MHIKQIIEEYLSSVKHTTVTLSDLQSLFEESAADPQQFSAAILDLEQKKVLEAIKAAGRTMKQPSLAYRYRINKSLLKKHHAHQLQKYHLTLHPAIQLEGYFALPEEQFVQDKPWIQRIDSFLKSNGLPTGVVPAPERSFQIAGNEKWITELGGEALLNRLGVWDLLQIHPVSDPLMLAVNPSPPGESSHSRCLHLIVENKTTFQALLPVLPSSAFSTLIYGCGNKITGNLNMFSLQYPVTDREHIFYYFGDLDYEGIRIWHEVNKQQNMIPARPFYEACLEQPYVLGKGNQRRSEEALSSFLPYFSAERREQIVSCLHSGGYYPQEVLSTQQLQGIWRGLTWKQWTDLN
ncbi:Wadjet anti-phage system protein JetD domain-containing protein [Paenibacillus sp. CAU 1782]